MKNHILLAILAVIIAISQTMSFNDEVNQEAQSCRSSCSENDDSRPMIVSYEVVDPVEIEYIDPDTDHPYTLYA